MHFQAKVGVDIKMITTGRCDEDAPGGCRVIFEKVSSWRRVARCARLFSINCAMDRGGRGRGDLVSSQSASVALFGLMTQ